MKVAILAGGFGTRLSEETSSRPKPMVEIGGRPILWHIMKIYASQGFNEFVIALGYKAETSLVEDMKDSVKYWRDEQEIMHVPKRKLEDILHINCF